MELQSTVYRDNYKILERTCKYIATVVCTIYIKVVYYCEAAKTVAGYIYLSLNKSR